MRTLKGTIVKRGGETARYWYETIDSVTINADSELRLSFSMPSKGGGRTQIQMRIVPEDFPTILETMSLVNRQAAMESMAAELARQVSTQAERDAKAVRAATKEARDEIRRRASQKYVAKMLSGDKDRERTVLNGVKEIISEIENREQPRPS
jgi:tRNA U54 and U55 pseudouridine synthase Pus10